MTGKTYQIGNRRTWYDFSLRLWTCVIVDTGGNQVGAARYTPDRWRAMRFIQGVENF